MNKEIQKIINENIQQVRQSNRTGSHLNCIRLNPSSRGPHNNEIIKRCLEYLELGIPFLTETIFHNGQRADILKPSIPEIEEILVSETDERFDKKDYPFRIIKVKI